MCDRVDPGGEQQQTRLQGSASLSHRAGPTRPVGSAFSEVGRLWASEILGGYMDISRESEGI